MNPDIIADIVAFWLSDSRDSPDRADARRGWWYEGGPAVDEAIRARFGDLVPRACARELMGWRDTPQGALALVLLLDQFTRNLYRGTVGAYAGDPCAFEVVRHAIDRGLDRGLHPVARIWLYHPFHHSEEVAEQDRGLELLRALRQHAAPDWRAYVERSIEGWTRHRDTSSPASAGSRTETRCSAGRARRRNSRISRRMAGTSVRGRPRPTQPADVPRSTRPNAPSPARIAQFEGTYRYGLTNVQAVLSGGRIGAVSG